VSEAAEIIINTIDGVDPFVRQQFSNMREKSRKLMAEKLMAEKKNLLGWWHKRTKEEQNEVRDALRKHGPGSRDDFNNPDVILFLDREVVRHALLEHYRVQGDLLPNLPSFIRRVCSGYALVWGVLRTQSV
jgi:hypothetical protein